MSRASQLIRGVGRTLEPFSVHEIRRLTKLAVTTTAFAALACDPVHRIAINAVPTAPIDSRCIAQALAPLGAVRQSSCFDAVPPYAIDSYSIPIEHGVLFVKVPVMDSAKTEATFAWSTIGAPQVSYVAYVRRTLENAYNDMRNRCGGLPDIAEAKHECRHRGCRR